MTPRYPDRSELSQAQTRRHQQAPGDKGESWAWKQAVNAQREALNRRAERHVMYAMVVIAGLLVLAYWLLPWR